MWYRSQLVYSWRYFSEREQCPCHYTTKTKTNPKGYKQEGIQACRKTCYWVIVTYSLLLSCHCILSFNKTWANLFFFFTVSVVFLWKVSDGIMNVIHNVIILQCNIITSSFSALQLPRHNLLAKINKLLGVSRFLLCHRPYCYRDGPVLRHLTGSSDPSWEAKKEGALLLHFMSPFPQKRVLLGKALFLIAKAVNSLTDQAAGVVPENIPLPLNDLEFTWVTIMH